MTVVANVVLQQEGWHNPANRSMGTVSVPNNTVRAVGLHCPRFDHNGQPSFVMLRCRPNGAFENSFSVVNSTSLGRVATLVALTRILASGLYEKVPKALLAPKVQSSALIFGYKYGFESSSRTAGGVHSCNSGGGSLSPSGQYLKAARLGDRVDAHRAAYKYQV